MPYIISTVFFSGNQAANNTNSVATGAGYNVESINPDIKRMRTAYLVLLFLITHSCIFFTKESSLISSLPWRGSFIV